MTGSMGFGIERVWPGRIEAGTAEGSWPRVASDELSGVLRVSDARVFQTGRQGFCRLWLCAAVCHPGVRKARVDLATATALIEFEPSSGSTSTAAMASTFAAAVHEALAAGENDTTDQAAWVALTAFPGPDSRAWEVSGRSSSHVRLWHPGLGADRSRRPVWLERLTGADGVTDGRSGWFSDTLTITFDPELTNEDRVLIAAHRAWLELESTWSEPSMRRARSSTSVVIDNRVRYANLVKAGGAFGLTLVGLAVPGVPTLPFLLATSYYLARSSPRLNEALLKSLVLGPILREGETHRGLSPSSKRKLIALTAAIVAVTVVVTPTNPVVLILIVLVSLVSIYETLRLPGVQTREGDGFLGVGA